MMTPFLRQLFVVIAALLPIACSGSGWTDEQIANAQNVNQAIKFKNEATRIKNQIAIGEVGMKEWILIYENSQKALSHAMLVRDDVLDKLDRDLKSHWKEELIEGLRLRLAFRESGDFRDELKGAALLDKFGDWIVANDSSIRIPSPR